MHRLDNSRRLWDRAQRVLPGGVNSNVKIEEQPQPLFFERAEESHLYDYDGNAYIDYTCGYGPIILGHAYPSVVSAVQQAAEHGFLYGGQHEGEVRLAEQLAELVPCIEMARFSCTGSEAVAAAVRVARAYTGRTQILRFAGHYHGWFDEQLAGTHPPVDDFGSVPQLESEGQPPTATANLLMAPWNDIAALRRTTAAHRDEIAAVLMEPIMCNSGVIMPEEGYLRQVRDLCTRDGILLIFDEVITGFRVHLRGAQGLLGVTPDLAVFGKALANGFPISCVGGRRDIMQLIATGRVVHAGTFNGNPLGVAAAVATIGELQRLGDDIYDRLRATGEALMSGIRRAAAAIGMPVLLQGPGPVFYMWFTDAQAITNYRDSARVSRAPYARFAAALLASGVRVIPGGRWYVSYSHTDQDIDQTLEAVTRVLATLAG